MDWLTNGTIVGVVLVFVVAVWTRLDERSVLRRLERLVQIRKELIERPEENSQSEDSGLQNINKGVRSLSEKVARREASKGFETQLINIGAVLFLIGSVAAAVYSELVRLKEPIPLWGQYLFLIAAVMGAIGVVCVLIVMGIWVTRLFKLIPKVGRWIASVWNGILRVCMKLLE